MFKQWIFDQIAARAQKIVSTHKPFVIGITGTVGKTTTSQFVYALLASKYEKEVYISPYSYNGEIGLPLSVLLSKSPGKNPFGWIFVYLKSFWVEYFSAYPKYLVLEYGIDTPHEMARLLRVARPNIGVLLNIEKNHVQQFPEFNDYAKEKLQLAANSEFLLYNLDTPFVAEQGNSLDIPKLSFGKNENAQLKAINISSSIKSLSFDVVYENQKASFCFALFGAFQITNILPAIALGVQFGMSLEEISDIFAHATFDVLKGRGTILKGVAESIIVDGSYNGGFTAITTGTSEIIKMKEGRDVVFFLGDMRELGDETQPLHEQLAKHIVALAPKQVVLVGAQTLKYIVPYLQSNNIEVNHFFDSRAAGRYISTYLSQKDPQSTLVYVKGSQNTIYLEEGIKEFLFDKRDYAQLCRQSPSWIGLKRDFFENVLETTPKN